MKEILAIEPRRPGKSTRMFCRIKAMAVAGGGVPSTPIWMEMADGSAVRWDVTGEVTTERKAPQQERKAS